MALDRVACGRKRTDQVLALDLPAQDPTQEAGLLRKAPLEDRSLLPRAQTRDRAGTLRGTQMAWLPSPRNDVHCRLRLSRRRARPFPPGKRSNPVATLATWSSQRSAR